MNLDKLWSLVDEKKSIAAKKEGKVPVIDLVQFVSKNYCYTFYNCK